MDEITAKKNQDESPMYPVQTGQGGSSEGQRSDDRQNDPKMQETSSFNQNVPKESKGQNSKTSKNKRKKENKKRKKKERQEAKLREALGMSANETGYEGRDFQLAENQYLGDMDTTHQKGNSNIHQTQVPSDSSQNRWQNPVSQPLSSTSEVTNTHGTSATEGDAKKPGIFSWAKDILFGSSKPKDEKEGTPSLKVLLKYPTMWSLTAPSYFKLLIFNVILNEYHVINQQFGSLNQKITFYPSSLVVSHSAKPFTFYDDTRIIHISLDLPAISIGKPITFSNHTCSRLKTDFYNILLKSMLQVQETAQRLLSLPGFSTLIECDTYLARYFQFETGIPSRMVCPRAYRNTVKKCKIWALHDCQKLTSDEKNWLKGKNRKRRSSWFCHAGIFGIFKALYESTGHTCETNHIENLRSTLKTITAAMKVSRQLTHVVNGKVVHLFKITDKMNTKLNGLIRSVRGIDKTFQVWQKELERMANKVACDDYLNMAFLSKFATENNRAFSVIMRFFEVQDVMTQLAQLNNKILFGSLDLPQFMFSEFLSGLHGRPKLKFTVDALKNNLPILANPIVDVEHNHNKVTINILAIVTEIPSKESFCTIEHLTPLKFNISNSCYEGPIKKRNLALITCPYTKHVIPTSTLNKCFVTDNAVLCPTNILQIINDIEWLGFPWSSGMKLSYPRYHLSSKSCRDLHPMIHLGGRFYLSTTTGLLTTNVGTLTVSPLTI